MLNLRNSIFLFIFLICNLFSFSQNLPNYDFENWEESKSFNNPLDWGTSNFSVYSVVNFNPVTQETSDVYSGNSSVKLQTIEKNVGLEIVKVAGVLTLGIFDINLSTRSAVIKGGIKYYNRPSVFKGYYKYSTPGIDSCTMGIYLTRYNSVLQYRDTIGVGVFTSGTQDEWSEFNATIEYSSELDPDSMNIIIISSDTSIFDTGSTLLIDKLYVDATLKINSIKPEIINIYPNPATDYIHISFENMLFISYSIIDIKGEMLISNKHHDLSENINVSMLNPGIYIIKINVARNKEITKLFIVN